MLEGEQSVERLEGEKSVERLVTIKKNKDRRTTKCREVG
jgi:hypothetical protein